MSDVRSRRNLLMMAAALLLPSGLALAEVERDGSTLERAVLVDAPDSMQAIAFERRWLTRHYPGWRKGRQTLLHAGGRSYDRIDITGPAGENKSIHFDITAAFASR
jgi:hypothetical protein